jgi:hypothetical protein
MSTRDCVLTEIAWLNIRMAENPAGIVTAHLEACATRLFDGASWLLKAGLSRRHGRYYQNPQKFPRELQPKCAVDLQFLKSYKQSSSYPIPAFTLCFV